MSVISMQKVLTLLVTVISLTGTSAGTVIQLHNQCPFSVTAFDRAGAGATHRHVLAAGGRKNLEVGNSWVAGLIWGSPSGNMNNGQASQIEFTINPPNQPGRDTYDISLVNAYNIPTLINPTKLAHGAKRAGHECGTPACIVHNINSFCKPPNSIVGADKACINRDGPGTSSTMGTRAFKTACPDAYSYSQDDSSSTYGCKSGSDYEVVFCYEQRVAEA